MKQSTRENRIIVPMDHSQEFLEKLILVVKFVEEYLSMDPSKRAHRDSNLVFTENMYTDVGRKYYFDVYNNNGELSVKLTYNYDGRRDRIVVDSGCLIGFIGIIENFEKEYPSITGKDDYHRYTNRRFDNRRHVHFGGPGSTSQAISPTTIQPQGVAIASNVNLKSNVKKSTERKSTHALKVCSDPAPCSFEQNGKKYHFEVVKGDKTFLRVTELIEDKRKTAIHIPIESVKLFLDSLNDMRQVFKGAFN
ncbi:hypothetical protein RF11_15427 [Thelohanellus kitauei]|uniref:Uncharacterized protein n=1 Tax=Thelohanellus kitauei TaxID=669202 RepID=A0A0C2MBQ0_THEKT|nr:hypothetical protein RF11_15427 [Thelohanellus kitauei]